ncbi:dephospho-CoA kinase [Dyella tabacisoli]|uniref:dephospho-CoA kinase n=1 Tax=Dyella tabacisoli TaxID=2282381 RepID=UPI001CDB8D37|nr:dephospho-CoA kinase [Dyella tabacisoli]
MTAEHPSYVIALTGGIASGKSAVAHCFEAHGIAVYDADIAARAVVAPGSGGLRAIVEAFGAEALDAEGQLDRASMRRRIFADDHARLTLEAIIHPRVRQWLQDHARTDRGPYCLLAIPLLTENIEHYRWVNRILLVDAPDSTRLDRLIHRDQIDTTLAQRMLDRQASRERRMALADDIIDNSGDRAALEAAVASLHASYLALARHA